MRQVPDSSPPIPSPSAPGVSPIRLRAMTTIPDFGRFKAERRRISMVTAYDAWAARIVAASNVDAILVGDSVAMVVHGHPPTVTATGGLLAIHTRAIARGAGGKFQISDRPFLSYRKGLRVAMDA